MNVRFEEAMLHLRGFDVCTLEKKINKKNNTIIIIIILMVMMMISHIESHLTQALLGFL